MSEKTSFAKRSIDKLKSKEFARAAIASGLAVAAFAGCGAEHPSTAPSPTEHSIGASETPSPTPERTVDESAITKAITEYSAKYTGKVAEKLEGMGAIADEKTAEETGGGRKYVQWSVANYDPESLQALEDGESRSLLKATLNVKTKTIDINTTAETNQGVTGRVDTSFYLKPGNPALAGEGPVSAQDFANAIENPDTYRIIRYAADDAKNPENTITVHFAGDQLVVLDDNEVPMDPTDPEAQKTLEQATNPDRIAELQDAILNPPNQVNK